MSTAASSIRYFILRFMCDCTQKEDFPTKKGDRLLFQTTLLPHDSSGGLLHRF
jgi:hypothetical protein